MAIQITAVGTVATDPKDIRLSEGVTLCTFRLAASERKFNRETQTWVDGETNWLSINVFRILAEHALASIHKGQRVFVHGKLRIKQWEREERSGTSVEIDAESIGHDLRWGTSTFHRDDEPHAHNDTPHLAGSTIVDGGTSAEHETQEPAPGWAVGPVSETSS